MLTYVWPQMSEPEDVALERHRVHTLDFPKDSPVVLLDIRKNYGNLSVLQISPYPLLRRMLRITRTQRRWYELFFGFFWLREESEV